MRDDLANLASTLGVYDPVDLAASVGALQLLPENADRQLRLLTVADLIVGVVARARSGDAPLKMSPNRWRDLLNAPPISNSPLPQLEDPINHLFVDQLTFDGGSFLVLTGIAEEPVFIARHLLKAVLQPAIPFPDALFAEEVHRLAALALVVGDLVAKRASLERGTRPGHPAHRRVVVPPAPQFSALKAAVSFAQHEIESLVRWAGATEADLARFVAGADGTQSSADLGGLALNQVRARPLVRIADRYVVVAPGTLLVALRHAIVSAAVTRGLTTELATAYRAAITDTVRKLLGHLHLHRIAVPTPADDHLPSRADWYRLDRDKLLYVVVLTDPLDAYDLSQPYSPWPKVSLPEQVRSHLAEPARLAEQHMQGLSEILFLVIVQGIGRPLALVTPGELAPPGGQALLMSAADLEVIALLEWGNPLALRQYAEAKARFRAGTQIVAYGELEEFAFYRSHRHGYYASDGPRPALAVFEPGLAEALHHEVRQRFDFHGVKYADEDSAVEVVLGDGDLGVPIYTPRSLADRTAILVERLALPVWVLGPETLPDARDGELYLRFADLISFWIWQFALDLEAPLAALPERTDRLLIRLDLRPAPDWLDWDARAEESDGDDRAQGCATCRVRQPDELHVELEPCIIGTLNRPDNAGERAVMRTILCALGELLDHHGVAASDPWTAWADTVVERHMPLGPKKKLVVLPGQTVARLRTDGLPPHRPVQEAAVERVLDEIGEFLDRGLHLPVGAIPGPDRETILKKLVAHLFEELEHLVASLAPDDLLPWLVAYNERLIAEHRRLLVTLPSHVALFGATPETVARTRRRLTEAAKALLPSRFLIEYAVACSPNGSAPISLATYDRLLALAWEIGNRGWESDLIHFKLADIKLARLPSGRLGQSLPTFQEGYGEFLDAYAMGTIGRSQEGYARNWNRVRETAVQSADEDALDRAAQSEFGFSVTELLNLLVEGINAGDRRAGAAKSAERSVLEAELSDALGWDEPKLKRALDLLSLSPRPSFLRPPAPFGLVDIYPWRFNRALSYLRRPFLIRDGPEAQEIVWGVRNLYETFDYLVGLLFSGRFKARTRELDRVIKDLQERDSAAFNDRVAETCEELAGLVVRRNVRKLGRQRIARANGEVLGDIDVLVAAPATRTLWSIETKDLDGARTPAELEHELRETFGTGGRHRSHVEIHIERTTWLREHLPAVLETLNVADNDAGKWSVRPLVVVSHEVMSPFVARSSVRVVPYRDLRAFLGASS